ncbi:MAG: HEPN domain-containing protein [bacterium]|nr:HEPN domain-containing protein [bacterium]MDZ4285338.1 HEPN domain-containing protein [Candidatus Sungbacteria bacterium]
MNSQSALLLLNAIDQTIHEIDGISGSNDLVDAYLAKFLVVYICGMYEEVIETAFTDFFVRNTSRQEVVTYARDSVAKSFMNPKFDKLMKLIGSFGNATWTSALKSMSSERIALDSIVENKNNIAHGHGAIITLLDIKQYYINSRPLIEKFDELLV